MDNLYDMFFLQRFDIARFASFKKSKLSPKTVDLKQACAIFYDGESNSIRHYLVSLNNGGCEKSPGLWD